MRVAISHFGTPNYLPGPHKAVITFCGLSLLKLNMAPHTASVFHVFQFPKYFRKFSLNMYKPCCNVTRCSTSSLTLPTVNTRSYHPLTASTLPQIVLTLRTITAKTNHRFPTHHQHTILCHENAVCF